jgi:predicted enzyme related to lactoylglutathione lyase
MPDRDGYIPGVPCWIDTSQPDPAAAVEFYSGLFGWQCEQVTPSESEYRYSFARIRGRDVAAIGSVPEGAPAAAMWNMYVAVESIEETTAKVLDAGGMSLRGPLDLMPNVRMAAFADPEGATFNLWQAGSTKAHKSSTRAAR